MKRIFQRLMVTLLILLFNPLGALAQVGDMPPLQRAEQIARQSSEVQAHFTELKQQALKIKDPALKKICLEFLGTPEFKLASRAKNETEIRKLLVEKHLLEETGSAPALLIPSHAPMPFIAAPASIWFQHHTFPGGLVFHTLTNLLNALSLGKNWEHVNQIHLRSDWLRAAPIWHDIAKTWTLEWMKDGSDTLSEGKIAGTGAHHILGIAEALMRKVSPDFVVVLASAHAPAHQPDELVQLIHYLQAAAIISGKSWGDAGLSPDGASLLKPAPLESFIHHLSDHDWVGSETSLAESVRALHETFPDLTPWKQDELFSTYGDLKITETFRESGTEGMKKLFTSHVQVQPDKESAPLHPAHL